MATRSALALLALVLALPLGAAPTPTPTLSPSLTSSAWATPTAGPCNIIVTIAGDGLQAYSGDNGPATSAGLSLAYGPSPPGNSVAVDAFGNVYFADAIANRVRRIDGVTRVITTVAGSGLTGGSSGDGGLASAALFSGIFAMALDSQGDLFLVDQYNSKVRKINALSGIVTTVAGSGAFGFSGDGGPATAATCWPWALNWKWPA